MDDGWLHLMKAFHPFCDFDGESESVSPGEGNLLGFFVKEIEQASLSLNDALLIRRTRSEDRSRLSPLRVRSKKLNMGSS